VGYVSRKQPKQYDPPTSHAKCTKKNCLACAELELTVTHIETTPREKYEWPGREDELITEFGQEN
jgi:hypothetical protein